MKKIFTIIALYLVLTTVNGQSLTIIEQDYKEALNTAQRENKLLFVDFYTTWCVPCHELDELVFQNESVQQELGEDFVLLKYNAENDSIFHLAKKHHVFSYPTGLILHQDGHVISRKYGFPGDDFSGMWGSVRDFANQGMELNGQSKFLTGYANTIDPMIYPDFYADYVERTNTKIDRDTYVNYWNSGQDMLSEGFFTTAVYFADRYIPDHIADRMVGHKESYDSLYGELNTEILFWKMGSARFDVAIAEKNQQKFEAAVVFVQKGMSADWGSSVIRRYTEEFEGTDL